MEELCHRCKMNAIGMKSTPLCKSCCKTIGDNDPYKKSLGLDKQNKIRYNMFNKYGDQFLADMETLSEGVGTLQAVGDKYGVSRERIRQIFNRLYIKGYGEVVKRKKKRQ